ncbi:hypothetical protein [Streptomyces sp. DH12]|uniref:hypothetical protein n=1 Tax=Streptomyces sp. DH12 TaxID=2857010 RepID=UPI001E3C94F8|nr:hypothetical protein [Streptomyces sp. DH12]
MTTTRNTSEAPASPVHGGERGELLRALAEQRGLLPITVREALDGASTTEQR